MVFAFSHGANPCRTVVVLAAGATAFNAVTAKKGGFNSVTVSGTCDEAMQKIVSENPNADQNTVAYDNGFSLGACSSPDEWMTAANRYKSSGLDRCVVCHNNTVHDVWAQYCDGSHSAPACH